MITFSDLTQAHPWYYRVFRAGVVAFLTGVLGVGLVFLCQQRGPRAVADIGAVVTVVALVVGIACVIVMFGVAVVFIIRNPGKLRGGFKSK